jgi:hypothetical protein
LASLLLLSTGQRQADVYKLLQNWPIPVLR